MLPISPSQLDEMHRLLRHCGQKALHMAQSDFQVYEKGVQDYVTDVDRALDRQLVQSLTALFPKDAIVSEENEDSRHFYSQREHYPRLWLIDPLDGTEDFIQAKSHYSIMLGTLEAERPTTGWVYAPVFDQLYFGGAELGLFQAQGEGTAEPLRETPTMDWGGVCPLLIGTKDRMRFGAAIAQHIPNVQFQSLGSFGLKVMEVVLGRAALYIYLNRRVKLWDTTGPLAIAQAAGLVCCDLAGNPIGFDPTQVDADTLTHHQPIVVGTVAALERWFAPLQQALIPLL